MLEDSRLIPLTSTPSTPLPFIIYANFPRPWVTIRSLSPHSHKRPCNYPTPVFHSRGFRWLSSDTMAHTPKQSVGGGKTPAPHTSHLLHTHWTALPLESQCMTSWWSGEVKEKTKTDGKSHKATWRDNIDLCVTLSVWVSVYEYMCSICHTESMIPLRAWKPPHTGNTCSTESAIVAS